MSILIGYFFMIVKSLKGSHNDLDQMLNSCSVDDDEGDISSKIWCDSDRHVVAASVGVIKTAKAMMKKLIKVIDTSGHCDTPDVVAQLDDFANVVSTMSPAVDDFVLSLYPPVKTDAVSVNVSLTVAKFVVLTFSDAYLIDS